ncbi:1-phosphofructokinase family hexose kinase [Phycisphaerales bacterium AB-hyl4]|uniref:1-phosphofructokinase family hexose kinase n=1 Tax=Natronomicrosphaera hydrolytica TaxID=3242702 RepID=A0ABV4U567_9BACT
MPQPTSIITVTLNTAIDRVLEVHDFHIGEHVLAREAMRYPAGKGINVSRALARIGRDNIATGFVGQAEMLEFDHLFSETGPGRAMCQLLAARGATRENITILDPKNHTDTHVRTTGYELTRRDVQRMVSKLGLLARQGSMVVFTGSLPPGLDMADFDTLLYVCIGGGAKVVLDVGGKLLADSTSLDMSGLANVEPEPVGGTGGSKMLWMVKPNRAELAEALGQPADALKDEAAVIDAGRRMARRVAWVVVTLGAEGALLFHQGHVWRGHCELSSDEVVNTVGCGDCMMAGMLDAQAAGKGPEDVLRWGIATATSNAALAGVAGFDRQRVTELAERCTIVDALSPSA